MKKVFGTLMFMTICIMMFGQEGMNTGILYGKDFVYSLSAPDGWLLDNKSGVGQGLHAVFYKKGFTWSNAEVVMYANTSSFDNKNHKTLNDLITYDVNTFKKNYSDILITDAPDIAIKVDLIAKVKYLSGKSYGNFEAIAYIDAGKNGVLVVVSSKTKEGLTSSLSAFENLVKSYLYISDKVNIQKTK